MDRPTTPQQITADMLSGLPSAADKAREALLEQRKMQMMALRGQCIEQAIKASASHPSWGADEVVQCAREFWRFLNEA